MSRRTTTTSTRKYLEAIPAERIFQIHLAGHSEDGPLLIDTHDHPVKQAVWDLYEFTLARTGPVSTLIEWDDAIPSFSELVAEADRARQIRHRLFGAPDGSTSARSER